MAVYVDPATYPWRGAMWGHLWADDVDELHRFARRLGLKREWYRKPPLATWRHYDIVASKRDLAIRLGAIPREKP